MAYRSHWLALTAATALTLSCVKENDSPRSPESDFIFTASTEEVQGSKTTVENGEGATRIVKWAQGDQISVWWSAEGHVDAVADAAGTTATFTPASAPGRHLFTQCGWAPTRPEASASGAVDPEDQPTSAAKVQPALDAGTILTVNAIYTSHPTLLYPTSFTQAQVDDIFSVFPACQGLQVDTGAETRAALLQYGRHLLQ